MPGLPEIPAGGSHFRPRPVLVASLVEGIPILGFGPEVMQSMVDIRKGAVYVEDDDHGVWVGGEADVGCRNLEIFT